MTDTLEPQTVAEETEYELQYDIVGRDGNGDVFYPAAHGPGQLGFATLDCATAYVQKLVEFDDSYYASNQVKPTYVVRPVFVSEALMYQQVSDLWPGCDACDAEEDAITSLPKIKQFD